MKRRMIPLTLNNAKGRKTAKPIIMLRNNPAANVSIPHAEANCEGKVVIFMSGSAPRTGVIKVNRNRKKRGGR